MNFLCSWLISYMPLSPSFGALPFFLRWRQPAGTGMLQGTQTSVWHTSALTPTWYLQHPVRNNLLFSGEKHLYELCLSQFTTAHSNPASVPGTKGYVPETLQSNISLSKLPPLGKTGKNKYITLLYCWVCFHLRKKFLWFSWNVIHTG